jgi:hypothetical protein
MFCLASLFPDEVLATHLDASQIKQQIADGAPLHDFNECIESGKKTDTPIAVYYLTYSPGMPQTQAPWYKELQLACRNEDPEPTQIRTDIDDPVTTLSRHMAETKPIYKTEEQIFFALDNGYYSVVIRDDSLLPGQQPSKTIVFCYGRTWGGSFLSRHSTFGQLILGCNVLLENLTIGGRIIISRLGYVVFKNCEIRSTMDGITSIECFTVVTFEHCTLKHGPLRGEMLSSLVTLSKESVGCFNNCRFEVDDQYWCVSVFGFSLAKFKGCTCVRTANRQIDALNGDEILPSGQPSRKPDVPEQCDRGFAVYGASGIFQFEDCDFLQDPDDLSQNPNVWLRAYLSSNVSLQNCRGFGLIVESAEAHLQNCDRFGLIVRKPYYHVKIKDSTKMLFSNVRYPVIEECTLRSAETV